MEFLPKTLRNHWRNHRQRPWLTKTLESVTVTYIQSILLKYVDNKRGFVEKPFGTPEIFNAVYF